MEYVVAQNNVFEIRFASSWGYKDPYNQVSVDVKFAAPDGDVFRVPAFWSDDNQWKVRFAGAELGTYTYQTVCSNTRDKGLHDQAGVIGVEPYSGPNPLFGHGRLRVARDRRHFEHDDGTPFFWVGDTWWMGLSSRLDWPGGFRELTADRVAKGFNVVQIVAGPYPDMDAWDPRGQNAAGFPFTEGFESINPEYYNEADLRIAHLVHSGIVPCIVGMWGYYLPQMGLEKAKKFWRNLIARYGAYPVVWCVCGEATMPYYLSETKEQDAAQQKAGWTEVMSYVRETDGYRNLVTIHPTQFGREQVEDPWLMDFEMLQTGHNDIDSVSTTAESVLDAVIREPRMPVVNAEVNYEGIMGRSWQNIQRLCFYHSVLNGTAGHTYGANGLWQMSTVKTPYGASPHGRCWGNTPWRDAMQLPGSRQIGIGGAFIRRYRWWEWESHPEWVGAERGETEPYALRAVGIPGKLRVIYIPQCWDPPIVRAFEPDKRYTACYFDPCTGDTTTIGDVTPKPDGSWTPPFPPEAHDWLLVIKAS